MSHSNTLGTALAIALAAGLLTACASAPLRPPTLQVAGLDFYLKGQSPLPFSSDARIDLGKR